MKISRGFTLLELLVVIAIIGILSAIVLAILNSARIEGRDSRRVADIGQIKTSLELYYDDAKIYPTQLSELVPTYIPTAPRDPSGDAYVYERTSGGARFHLGANLELSRHQALRGDRDSVSDNINGADSADCSGGTTGRFCYDVEP